MTFSAVPLPSSLPLSLSLSASVSVSLSFSTHWIFLGKPSSASRREGVEQGVITGLNSKGAKGRKGEREHTGKRVGYKPLELIRFTYIYIYIYIHMYTFLLSFSFLSFIPPFLPSFFPSFPSSFFPSLFPSLPLFSFWLFFTTRVCTVIDSGRLHLEEGACSDLPTGSTLSGRKRILSAFTQQNVQQWKK